MRRQKVRTGMKKRTFPFYLLGIGFLVLNGCMAMGVPGMRHHASHEGRSPGRTVIRQLHAESADIDLVIPPLLAGIEATISVELSAPQDGDPIPGAQVVFTVQRSDRPGGTPDHSRTPGRGESGTRDLSAKAHIQRARSVSNHCSSMGTQQRRNYFSAGGQRNTESSPS